MSTLRNRPAAEALGGLRKPVLIVEGQVRLVPSGGTELARLLPNARYFVMEQVGHDPWYSDPERFFGEVLAFLRRN